VFFLLGIVKISELSGALIVSQELSPSITNQIKCRSWKSAIEKDFAKPISACFTPPLPGLICLASTNILNLGIVYTPQSNYSKRIEFRN
jgi:hypothetical protein